MAITTLDQAIAGMRPPEFFSIQNTPTLVAGRPASMVYLAGYPGAATAPSPGMAGESLTSYNGAIPLPPASNNTHVSSFSAVASGQPGMLILCDRLWQNSGINITSTSPQSVNSVTWPARDKNGATSGDGVYIGVEVSGATGSGTPTLTLTYTNSSGAPTRTGTNIRPTVASSAIGTFYPIGLAAGDTGVRSIQTYQQSATWTSGTIHLVAYRPILALPIFATGIPATIDALSSGLPRIYNNSCLFLIFIPQTTSATGFTGSVVFTQG